MLTNLKYLLYLLHTLELYQEDNRIYLILMQPLHAANVNVKNTVLPLLKVVN